MPSDTDKAYVKKHKINDMLNELFNELTSKKPEDPVAFAFRFFESKIPAKPENLLVSKMAPLGGKSDDQPPENLIMRLFSRVNASVREDQSAANSTAMNKLDNFPLYAVNIMNKIDRINVKLKKELTNDEILEKENITYFSKDDEQEDEASSKKPVIITYKNELRNRENELKHKNQLKQVIVEEIKKQNDPNVDNYFKIDKFYSDDEDQMVNEFDSDDDDTNGAGKYRVNYHEKKNYLLALKEDEQNEELEDELVTGHVKARKEKGKKKKIPFVNMSPGAGAGGGGGNQPPKGVGSGNTPAVKLIICQVCSKVQKNEQEIKNDFTNKEFESVNNEPLTSRRTGSPPMLNPPIVPHVEPASSHKEDLTLTQTKPPSLDFMDFFKSDRKNDEKNLPNKKSLNLDDDIESASQVSGPRKVEQYEAPTNRSAVVDNVESASRTSKESGVLAWVMARQQSSAANIAGEEPIELKPTPSQEKQPKASSQVGRASNVSRHSSSTLVGNRSTASRTSKQQVAERLDTSITSRKKSQDKGPDEQQQEQQQQWKIMTESNSDVSSLVKNVNNKIK